MKIDLSSLAFNSVLDSGGGTPTWSTALGQNAEYKFSTDGFEDIVVGMVYNAIPCDGIQYKKGKGGKLTLLEEDDELILVSDFKKVYVNNVQIDSHFIMLLIKQLHTKHHVGRRSIKYSDSIGYSDGSFSNAMFYRQVCKQFGIADDGCWFCYEINVKNQDELHFSAVIVDSKGIATYKDAKERKDEWIDLLDLSEDEKARYVKTETHRKQKLGAEQFIYYGCPGSGKSHKVRAITDSIDSNFVCRTTFHPDTDYASFVGCYKPLMNEDKIEYRYSAQVFTDAYVKAWKNPDKEVYLIIEEINRGNCAQIFGDLFQLLDRDKDTGMSEYPVMADKDLTDHLVKVLGEDHEGIKDGELKLPSNLIIYATMNTSDQSLFPMDSAFKRRWEWEYVPIEYGANKESYNYIITIGEKKYRWVDFLKVVNEHIYKTTSSEDKQMGNFFIKKSIDSNEFVNKVMFYIWNEVCKEEYGTTRNFFRTPEEGNKDGKEFKFVDLFDKAKTNDYLIGFMNHLKIGEYTE